MRGYALRPAARVDACEKAWDIGGCGDSGQACDLPLLGGTARVVVDSGVIAFADPTTGLFMTGAVTAWVSGTGRTGALQWQFQAEGW
jgi:hypothetical protein